MFADQNLLFGILAWQQGVVARNELLQAMKEWSFEKSEPLGAVLERRGAIDGRKRELLDEMVAAHVSLHGGATASLRSLGPSATSRDGSAEFISHLERVQQTSRRDGDASTPDSMSADKARRLRVEAIRAPTGAETLVSDGFASDGRFQILRPFAEGGLGAVFVARDQELGREVALKEIKVDRAFHQESQARFVLEAEVTGGLDHPGIVAVYAAGIHADGRPYYAMRLLRGGTFEEAIKRHHALAPAQRRSDLHDLLSRFVVVCRAVGYAHSRGILHRDLKPSNVMLGRYGETLVVDWGLAKAMASQANGDHDHSNAAAARDESQANESSSSTWNASHDAANPSTVAPLKPRSSDSVEATLQGKTLGTAAYMSPEQAAGETDRLGPATDIYALGATLYHLLTGQPSQPGPDAGRAVERASRAEFALPRSVNPRISSPLQSICLKAMALKPVDRYATALELAEDIERFLADERVAAHADSFAGRVRRWLRKHPSQSAFISIALGATFICFAALSSALAKKNNELAMINQQQQAATQAMEENAAAAQAQSQMALSTLTDVIDNVQKKIRDTDGSEAAEQELLKVSVATLEKLATQYMASMPSRQQTDASQQGLRNLLKNISQAQRQLGDVDAALRVESQLRSLTGAEDQAAPDKDVPYEP